jgi:hypothetical protein
VASNVLVVVPMRTLPSLLALALVFATSAARADDEGEDHYVTRDTHMRNAPLVGGGVALTVVGGLAIPVGALILMFPHDQPECVSGQFACSIDYTARDWTGAGILAGGIAMVAAGIPMIIWGGHHVPVSITPSGPLGSSGATLAIKF